MADLPVRIEGRRGIERWRGIERCRIEVQTEYAVGMNFADPRAACEPHRSTECALPMRLNFKTAARSIMRPLVLTAASMEAPRPSAAAGSAVPGRAEAPSEAHAASAVVGSTGPPVEAASMEPQRLEDPTVAAEVAAASTVAVVPSAEAAAGTQAVEVEA